MKALLYSAIRSLIHCLKVTVSIIWFTYLATTIPTFILGMLLQIAGYSQAIVGAVRMSMSALAACAGTSLTVGVFAILNLVKATKTKEDPHHP